MYTDLFDVDKLVSINKLEEVTNPIIMDKSGIPTKDGLLSVDIFGRATADRKDTYAYIDLGGHFFNPLFYKNLKRLDRRFEEIVSGTLKVSIKANGELVDDENGWTGIDALYKNFDKIKFKKGTSSIRFERISLVRNVPKKEAFVSKWLVIPAFYRDARLDSMDKGKVSYAEINKPYSKLLRLSRAISNDDINGISLISNNTKNMIQNTLVEIYDMISCGEIKGKYGAFRKDVLGKSVDYGIRSVITAPLFNVNKWDEMVVDFYHCGLPLSQTATAFFPFILKYVKEFFYNEVYLRKDNFPVFRRKENKIVHLKITNAEELCSDEYITKLIDSYIQSPGDRFKTISLKNDQNIECKLKFVGKYNFDNPTKVTSNSTIINRPLTITDIIYRAAIDVTEDKHVVITRYPLTDYFNIVVNKINVLSTLKTAPVIISNKVYHRYPVIDPELKPSQVSTLFFDTLQISNLYLAGMGGDYDGDQVSIRGVFSQKANKECEAHLKSIKNIVDINGQVVRTVENEAIQAVYTLTNDEESI